MDQRLTWLFSQHALEYPQSEQKKNWAITKSINNGFFKISKSPNIDLIDNINNVRLISIENCQPHFD